MSVSTLAFSATLPPFNHTNGFNNNFSNTNLSASGNLSVSKGSTPNNPIVSGSVTANGINFYEKDAHRQLPGERDQYRHHVTFDREH
jgi:hypothetical protein